MRDAYFNRAYALVSWNEVRRDGPYVFMRRGTGETGWWHDCTPPDYGGNPMDRSELGGVKCRTCDAVYHPSREDSASSKASSGGT